MPYSECVVELAGWSGVNIAWVIVVVVMLVVCAAVAAVVVVVVVVGDGVAAAAAVDGDVAAMVEAGVGGPEASSLLLSSDCPPPAAAADVDSGGEIGSILIPPTCGIRFCGEWVCSGRIQLMSSCTISYSSGLGLE